MIDFWFNFWYSLVTVILFHSERYIRLELLGKIYVKGDVFNTDGTGLPEVNCTFPI